MHQACPELDLTCQGSNLVDQVHRCASSSAEAAQKLMHKIAGVGALQEAGLRPSALALNKIKQVALEQNAEESEVCTALAEAVPWLEPQDVIDLIVFVMNDAGISRLRQMEVLGHIRSSCEED